MSEFRMDSSPGEISYPLRERLGRGRFTPRVAVLLEKAQTNWGRDLGKNDFYHSQSVERLLGRMVPPRVLEQLLDGEIFLLLCAVYLHDICRGNNRCPEEGESHEIKAADKILKEWPNYYLKNKDEAYAVSQIVRAHAPEEIYSINKVETDFGIEDFETRKMNLRFLAALLRIADELDHSFIRIQGIAEQQHNPRRLIHWIEFDQEEQRIEIQARPQSHEDCRDLEILIQKAQNRLDEVQHVLKDKKLYYHLISLNCGQEQGWLSVTRERWYT